MDILMDTHTILWFFENDEKLSKSAIEVICNPINKKYVSIATLWEAAIKYDIGKLKLSGGFEGFIEAIDDNGFNLLNINPDHVKLIIGMPYIHRDPFDRIIIAQAIIENMFVMTSDANILKYEIKSIW